MFLDKLCENNPQLFDSSLKLFNEGKILPDTYVIDYDAIIENGTNMQKEADKYGIRLYFMLKQIGRNPLIGLGLQKAGLAGCVAVDYKEALLMAENGVKLGNVGHLVQIPKNALKMIVKNKPEIITVYSLDKVKEINELASELNIIQSIMLRVNDNESHFYSGQIGGFDIDELDSTVREIEAMSNVYIGGLTVFPALLYDEKEMKVIPTSNMSAMNKARSIMDKMGYKNLMINIPSCTCTGTMSLIDSINGNCGEPGHGLTGTTPLHKHTDQPERVGYLYLSEVSHNYGENAYCYGGGYYRRGHLDNALVGYDLVKTKAYGVDDDSIDYHFQLKGNWKVGDPVIMCYRTQMFTTRSHIAVVKGVKTGNIELMGLYNGLGEIEENNWGE